MAYEYPFKPQIQMLPPKIARFPLSPLGEKGFTAA